MKLSWYLMCNASMLAIAILGILLNLRNLWFLLLYIELMFIAVSANFIAYAKLWNDIHGQIFVLFILTITTTKLAISLAGLVRLFKQTGSLSIKDLSTMRH